MAPRVQLPDERRVRILETVLDVARERGFDGFTVEEVASRCKASKATLYRHWPTRQALLVAAIERYAGETWEVPPQGAFRDDVLAGLRLVASAITRAGGFFLALMEAGRRDPLLEQEGRRRFSDPHARMWEELVQRWRGEESIRGDIDLMWLRDLCESLLAARLLSTEMPLDDGYLARFVDAIIVPLFTVPRGLDRRQLGPLQQQ